MEGHVTVPSLCAQVSRHVTCLLCGDNHRDLHSMPPPESFVWVDKGPLSYTVLIYSDHLHLALKGYRAFLTAQGPDLAHIQHIL